MPPEMSEDALREEIVRLGPWLLDVEVRPGLTTQAAQAEGEYDRESFGRVGFYAPREHFQGVLRRVYPDGLAGRSVLDCACNCGAFSFWAKEEGAAECLGFDVRPHWIEQARFLAANRAEPSDGMRFEVMDLYDLPQSGAGQFDITFFNGILYHLPDPVTGLKAAADMTRELIVLNTATRLGHPDGALIAARESREKVASGVYGLNWFPTGPQVVGRMFEWMGFPHWRCTRWRAAENQGPGLGRMELIAAREEALLDHYDDALDPTERVVEMARTAVPPGARVLVAGEGELEVPGRHAEPFAAGAGAGALERQHGAFLLVPAHRRAELGNVFLDEVEERFAEYARVRGAGVAYSLGEPEDSG
jgi:tRNA (mo5U34)-methyltransferase